MFFFTFPRALNSVQLKYCNSEDTPVAVLEEKAGVNKLVKPFVLVKTVHALDFLGDLLLLSVVIKF